MNHCAITITAKEKAELLPIEEPGVLNAREVRGSTLVTLISPGTEIAWSYLGVQQDHQHAFPKRLGYASVFRAEHVGSEVCDLEPGIMLLYMGNHQSYQQADSLSVVPVPSELSPHQAVLARLMGVTMTSLMTTSARPGDLVLVTGAGPVGYLGAHLFALSGYDVRVVEPNEKRRAAIQRSGIQSVYATMPIEDAGIRGQVALVLECSGHEQAALEGARLVRRGGEVVLVGVPWQQRTNITAHELLSAVFHQYAVLRSGWEWELPNHASPLCPHSIFDGFRLALRWLAERRIPLEGLIAVHDPSEAQSVYQSLLHGTTDQLFHVFEWTRR